MTLQYGIKFDNKGETLIRYRDLPECPEVNWFSVIFGPLHLWSPVFICHIRRFNVPVFGNTLSPVEILNSLFFKAFSRQTYNPKSVMTMSEFASLERIMMFSGLQPV